MTKTIDLQAEMQKQQAQQDAAMQAEIEAKKKEAEQRFLDYQAKQAALRSQLEEAEKQRQESAKQVVSYTTERMPVTRAQLAAESGATLPTHQAKYQDPNAVIFTRETKVPIYTTEYDPAAIEKVNFITGQLSQLETEASEQAKADPYYSEKYSAKITGDSLAKAEQRLESLKQQRQSLEVNKPIFPGGGRISDTQRRANAQAELDYSNNVGRIQNEINALESYVQSKAANPLVISEYTPKQFSSPRNAIGYNTQTGRVELGVMGVGGAQVVSQSKAEDVMDLQRIGKEAGYTKGATIDPRIAVFNPVDTGILTPGFKAQPHKDIIDAFKANTTTQTTIKLNENLNLSDQTPQEKSMRLEPIRDFVFKAADQGRPDLVIKSGGKTKIVKTEDAYREFVLGLRTDPNTTIEAPTLVSLSESLEISDTKMGLTGFSQDITGKTNALVGKESEKEKILQPNTFIPLSISKDGELKGFGQYDNKFEMLTLGKTESKEQPGQTNDFIEAVNSFTKRVESGADNIDSDILRFGAGAVKDIYLTGPSAANLINQFYLDPVEGTKRKEMYVPETSFGIVTSSFIESAKQAAESKDFNKFVLGLSSTSTQLSRRADEKGLAMVAGEFIGAVAPIGSGKLSPLKLLSYTQEVNAAAQATAKGVKFTLTATRTTGKNVVKTFDNYAEAAAEKIRLEKLAPKTLKAVSITAQETPIQAITLLGKPILTKVDGAYGIGSNQLKDIPRLTEIFKRTDPSGRGQEIPTLTKLGQGVFKSKEAQQAAIDAGLFLERDPQAIAITNEMIQLVKKGERVLKPKQQQELPNVTSLVTAAEQEVLKEQILPTIPKAKGNYPQITQIRPELVKGSGREFTGDIDADIKGPKILRNIGLGFVADKLAERKAARLADDARQKFLDIGDQTRAYEVKGTKLYAGQADPDRPEFDITLKKGQEAHGTELENALQIKKYGPDPEARPYGMPAFFTAKNAEIFENFAAAGKKSVVAVGEVDKTQILTYGKIPKRARNELLDKSFEIERTSRKPQWEAWQELLAGYAKERGYKGVTKPYHSTELNAPKYETIHLTGDTFTISRIERPAAFGIREGTEKKVLELLTHKDAPTPESSPSNEFTQVYGRKYTGKKLKAKTKGGQTVKQDVIENQFATKIASSVSIQGPRTEKYAGKGQADYLKEGMEFQTTPRGYGVSAPPARFKDMVDLPIAAKEIGLRFEEVGKTKEGKRLQELAGKYEELYPELDFAKGGFNINDLNVPEGSTLNDIAKSVYSPSSPAGVIKPTAESLRPRSQQKEKDTVSKITGDSKDASASRYDSVSSRINETLSKVNGSASRSRDSSSRPSVSKTDSISKLLGYGSKSQSSPARSQAKFDSSTIYGPSPAKYGPSPARYGGGSPGADVVSKITGSPGRQSPATPVKVTPLDIITPKPVAGKFYKPKTKTDRQKPDKPKEREDFLGSSFVSDVMGFRSKKKDFDYGDELTARLVESELKKKATKHKRDVSKLFGGKSKKVKWF